MKNIFLTVLIISSVVSYADDYESAQRFNGGDTVSADVLNDILDRIELSLITSKSSDFVGTWDILQTVTPTGCGSTGRDCDMSGRQTAVDDLYSQRTDSVTFSDDGDGTFSLSTSSYCSFLPEYNNGNQHNLPCNTPYSVVGGIFIMANMASSGNILSYSFFTRKISPSRYLLTKRSDSGATYNVIQLDKQSLPPKAPKSLAIALTSSKASLTWTAGDTSETGYTVKRKSSVAASFSDLETTTAESYEDTTIEKGNNYWYRVFANDSDGASIGSNVVRITYVNIPPSVNLLSTISVNEGVTEVVDVRATDADGDSLTYTISSQAPSNDATNFSISSAGIISFNSAPDWENPSDYNTDNIYTINVSVSDGTETIDQDLSIVVINVNN